MTSIIAEMPDLGGVNIHPSVNELEIKFSNYLGGGFSGFYNSGTSAYSAAIFGLDLPKDSEVIVPSLTFRGTVTPLFQFGLHPVLVSCDPITGSIDPKSIEMAITSNTSAIVVNHQWGYPAKIEEICSIAEAYSLKIIEDASHAHGTKINGKSVGTFGDIAFFSCGTTKLLSGGLGGILFSTDKFLFDRASLYGLAKHRCLDRITHNDLKLIAKVGVGVNLRGHPIAAHLILDHLNEINKVITDKNKNLFLFKRLLSHYFPFIEFVERCGSWTHGTWYKLPCHIRDDLTRVKFLKLAQVQGLRVKECDERLGLQFAEAYYSFKKSISSDQFNLSFRDLDVTSYVSILLFDTRDLYDPDFDWDELSASVSALATQLKESSINL